MATSEKSRKSRKSSCKIGQIKRSSYTRKGYERKSYSRKSRSGKTSKIRGAYVSRTHVPATCVPAKGKALIRGYKTPQREKVLPKLKKEVSLRRYGYATHNAESTRREALRKASENRGDLEILRRLVAISNYQADPEAKKIMKEDVKYLSLRHAKNLEREGRRSHSVYEK